MLLVITIAAMIGAAISAIAHFLQFSWLFGGDDDESPLGMVGSIAAILVAPLAAMMLQLAISRHASSSPTRPRRSSSAKDARSRTPSSTLERGCG